VRRIFLALWFIAAVQPVGLLASDSGASVQRRNDISGSIGVTTGRESNVYLHTTIPTTHYNQFTIDNNTTVLSDLFVQYAGQLTWRSAERDQPQLWSTTLSWIDKHYRRYDDLHLLQTEIQSGPAFSWLDGYLAVPLFFKHIRYGGQSYLNLYGIAPKYTRILDKKSALSVKVSAYRKRYIPLDKRDWNSDHYDAAARMRFVSHSGAILYGTIGGIFERRTQGKRTDVSYDSAFVSGRFWMPLWRQKLHADIGWRIERRIYRHKHPNLARRKETRTRIDMGLVRSLTDHLTARLNYTYTHTASTIEAYTHHNSTIAFSLSATF
jgi:hypothetical protein